MRRKILIALLALVTLFLVAGGAAFYLLNNEAFLKSQLTKQVRKFTGRELVVSGPLELQLGKETTLQAGQVTFSNASWAEKPHMVSVGRLELTVDIPSLFGDNRPRIAGILIEDCDIDLRKNVDGDANWDMLPDKPSDKQEKNQRPPIKLGGLLITDCQLVLDTPTRNRPLQVVAQNIRLERKPGGRVQGSVNGSINEEEISVNGWLEPASAILTGESMEHDLAVKFGAITLESAGTVADAKNLKGANIATRFQGPSMNHLLESFSLPPFSSGDFDFRLNLDSSGDMTVLDIDGDLGSIMMKADGELDRLLRPTTGKVEGSFEGSDLQALLQVFGVEGALATPYSLVTETRFDRDVIRIVHAELQAAGDRINASGNVIAQTGLPGSALDFQLESTEIGRWVPLTGKPAMQLGALSLKGNARIDGQGSLIIDAGADFLASRLEAKGSVGPLAGPYEPDLAVSLTTENARPLLALAGKDNFPEAPVKLNSQVRLAQNQVHLSGLMLDLAGHHASVDGILNLDKRFTGSELDVTLDIHDVSDLGRLFGKQDLPQQPLKVSSLLKPIGKGLSFTVTNGALGDISLTLDGRIADLDQPLGLDAKFDVVLPDLNVLAFALPDIGLPDGAFSASGAFHNEDRYTRLEDVSMRLGELEATVDGRLAHDNSFDLKIYVSGPDATQLKSLTGLDLVPEPFSLSTELKGDLKKFNLGGLAAKLGKSELSGDLTIGLGTPKQVSGSVYAPYLDFSKWKAREKQDQPPAAESEAPSKFVFDDTPALVVGDYGVDVDTHIKIDDLDLGETQLKDINLGVLMQKHYLKLDPLFVRGKASGQISGRGTLDGRSGVPALDINLHAEDLRTGLGAGVGEDISTWPPGDFDIRLTGNGRTQREMARSLNGKIRVSYGSGLVQTSSVNFLLSDFLTELFTTLNPFAETAEHTRLDCIVAAADIVDGQVAVAPVVFNLEQVKIVTGGTINLETEAIDLTFNTVPRKGLGLSASALINPFIKVGGRLQEPTIELDPASTVVSGGIAVATVGLSILAKSMNDRFLGSKDPCGDAQKEIDERDSATP